jgi:hypothetical protein
MARAFGSNRKSEQGSTNGVENVAGIDYESTSDPANGSAANNNGTDSPIVGDTGSDNGSDGKIVDPDTIPVKLNKDGSPRKKRGRKSGSNSTGRASKSETADSLNALLYSLHKMGASFLHIPEMELSEEESQGLAKAIARVTDLYELPIVSEKAMAWIGLACECGKIYGPRIAAHSINAKKAKVAKAQPIALM